MKKIKYLSIFLLITNFSYGQLNDLSRIDYTIIPNNDSDIEYTRFRALFNYPIKMKKKGRYLFLGLDYSNIHLRMGSNNLPFNKDDLNDFKLLDLNIGYTKPLKNYWRLGIRLKPGFSTNLTADAFNFEDIVISADIVFIKDKTKDEKIKKPYRIILGVSYSENRGLPFPLPFISYYKKIHSNWSYNVGIPKTNFQYHISKKNRLKLYTELDGFTANLQNGIFINNDKIAESINMSLITGGLQYEYHFMNHFELYARSGYIISNRVKLRDDKRNNVFTLDNEHGFYFRGGIRLKL
jgi:hypothetical protein